MSRLSASRSRKATRKFAVDLDGRPIHNKILLALPKSEREEVLAKLEYVSLPLRTILNDVGEPIRFVYFLNDGLASILSIMEDGSGVEVGLCGREGFVGVPLLAGLSSSDRRTIVQVAGNAHRVSAADFSVALRKCPQLSARLLRFAQEMALQASQIAACNRLHEVDERLGRWLLMSQDRLGGDLVPLTQEFLAHMLGTRRASVTVAAGILQKAGMIAYTRGDVKIKNRALLEESTCECYKMMTQQLKQWREEAG